MLNFITGKITDLAHHAHDLVGGAVDRVVQSIRKSWTAHRTAMQDNGAYRQAFYAGGTALLSAGSTRNLWMAVVGMLLSLYVAVFGPIKTSWTSRPLASWDDDERYERW